MNSYLDNLVQILHVSALRLHDLHYDAIQLTECVHAAGRLRVGPVDQVVRRLLACAARTVVRIVAVCGPAATLRLVAVRGRRSDQAEI